MKRARDIVKVLEFKGLYFFFWGGGEVGAGRRGPQKLCGFGLLRFGFLSSGFGCRVSGL